jgi:hypothetical protein
MGAMKRSSSPGALSVRSIGVGILVVISLAFGAWLFTPIRPEALRQLNRVLDGEGITMRLDGDALLWEGLASRTITGEQAEEVRRLLRDATPAAVKRRFTKGYVLGFPLGTLRIQSDQEVCEIGIFHDSFSFDGVNSEFSKRIMCPGLLDLLKRQQKIDRVLPFLVEALKDEDHHVQGQAAYAIGTLGPKAQDALPALQALLKNSEYPLVRRRAQTAIRKITGEGVQRP